MPLLCGVNGGDFAFVCVILTELEIGLLDRQKQRISNGSYSSFKSDLRSEPHNLICSTLPRENDCVMSVEVTVTTPYKKHAKTEFRNK